MHLIRGGHVMLNKLKDHFITKLINYSLHWSPALFIPTQCPGLINDSDRLANLIM